jgi:hypothetical protein
MFLVLPARQDSPPLGAVKLKAGFTVSKDTGPNTPKPARAKAHLETSENTVINTALCIV